MFKNNLEKIFCWK